MTTVGSKGSCTPFTVNEEEGEDKEKKMEEGNVDWLRKLHNIAYEDQRYAKIMLEHQKHECFVSYKEITDMVYGEAWLDLCHLSIWCTYLYRQCVERGADDLFGFVCPHKMNLKGMTNQAVSESIQQILDTTNKRVYLAPFCNSNHWQLVILLPKENTVVWMCSFCRQPKKAIKEMFVKAVKGDSTSATKWLYPIMPIQPNGYHCGYYVMKFMLTIVTAGIVDNWEKVFNSAMSYTDEEIKEIRQQWAEFFLKIRTEQKDTLFRA